MDRSDVVEGRYKDTLSALEDSNHRGVKRAPTRITATKLPGAIPVVWAEKTPSPRMQAYGGSFSRAFVIIQLILVLVIRFA